MKDFKNMTKEEIKEEFIKWFGEEAWKDDEILDFLDEIVFIICNEDLGVNTIPVIFEIVPGNIAIYDNKLKCIKINSKYKDDKITMVAAIVHELEHYYQILYAFNMNTPKAKRWKNELENYIDISNPTENIMQEIEIDAEAFTEVILSCEFGINYRNPIPDYQEVIDNYIKSG